MKRNRIIVFCGFGAPNPLGLITRSTQQFMQQNCSLKNGRCGSNTNLYVISVYLCISIVVRYFSRTGSNSRTNLDGDAWWQREMRLV